MARAKTNKFKKYLPEMLRQNNITVMELVYRYQMPSDQQPFIGNSRDAYLALLKAWDPDTICLREEFKAALMKTNGQLIAIIPISEGTRSTTTADPALIIGAAILGVATRIIIAHNHPNGLLRPSDADRVLTKKLKEGARLFDTQLSDHLIVTPSGYYSFADHGEL